VSVTFEWNGDVLSRGITSAMKKELRVDAEMVLAKSVEQCPVETGALRRSATVNGRNSDTTQELSYNTPYAHRQHEDLSYNHPVGNAKFLENPVRQYASKVFQLLTAAATRGMKGG
jgi:hypothetical protein